MAPPTRYHPLLVMLHWGLAVMIVAMLGVGFAWLGQMAAGDPRRLPVLTLHMTGGIVTLALMTLRLAVRTRTLRPARASTGNRMLDRLALVSHYAFYVIILSIVGTGLATAIDAGLPAILLEHFDARLPADFTIYAAFIAHAILATLLANLIVLHLLGVGYHLFIRRDRLLLRMSFARRDRGL